MNLDIQYAWLKNTDAITLVGAFSKLKFFLQANIVFPSKRINTAPNDAIVFVCLGKYAILGAVIVHGQGGRTPVNCSHSILKSSQKISFHFLGERKKSNIFFASYKSDFSCLYTTCLASR